MSLDPPIWISSFQQNGFHVQVRDARVAFHVGETVIGKSFRTRCGGKGANQAVAVARLCKDERRMRFITALGSDSYGNEFLQRFEKYGVSRENVIALPEISTGLAMICIDSNGENSITVIPGANAALTSSLVHSLLPNHLV